MDISQIFNDKVRAAPQNPRLLRFDPFDADPPTRTLIAKMLAGVVGYLGTNHIMGYDTHIGFVALAANELNIGFGAAVKQWNDPKEWGDPPRLRLIGAVVREEVLRNREAALPAPLDIIIIDEMIYRGDAALFLAQALRRAGFKVTRAVFLTHAAEGNGPQVLSENGIDSYYLTSYRPG